MGWEPEKLSRTLIIDVYDAPDKKKRYAVRQEMRVRRPNGETYLEPIPGQFFITGSRDVLRFDEVEFYAQTGDPRKETGGDLNFHSWGDRAVRTTA